MKQPPSTPNAMERRSTFAATTVANNSCPLPPVPSPRASLGAAVDRNGTFVGNLGELQKMKNQTNTQLVVCSSLALVLALALCSPVQAQSAQTDARNRQQYLVDGHETAKVIQANRHLSRAVPKANRAA